MEHCRLTKYVCRRQFHFVPMKTTKRRHDYFRFIDKEIGPKEVCAFPRLCLRFMEEEDLNTGFPRPPASTSPGWQGAPGRWWTCGTSTIVTGSTALSHGSHDTAAWPAGHMQTRALGPSPPCLTQQAPTDHAGDVFSHCFYHLSPVWAALGTSFVNNIDLNIHLRPSLLVYR